MNSTELIGNFNRLETRDALSHLRLVLPVRDFVLDWRRYNLVSNYVAEYSAYYFEHKDKAENLISSVLYELIEHMAAGSRHEARLDIQFSTTGEWLIFELSSSFSRQELGKLRDTLRSILEADIESYYAALLEEDLEKPATRRILGLAMVAHDYRAELSAALEGSTGFATLRTRVRREEINA